MTIENAVRVAIIYGFILGFLCGICFTAWRVHAWVDRKLKVIEKGDNSQ